MYNSPPALEIAGGTQDGNGLIHHPLANAEVAIDPFLEVFVVGDFVGVETGGKTSRTLHTCQKGGEEDSVKSVVGESAEHGDHIKT